MPQPPIFASSRLAAGGLIGLPRVKGAAVVLDFQYQALILTVEPLADPPR